MAIAVASRVPGAAGAADRRFLEPPQCSPQTAAVSASTSKLEPRPHAPVLAVQTFLNDIKAGGGTYFVAQDHTVPPKKGKTVIWPAGFTHAHRGEVAPAEEKYVITGWISFLGS
jgi:hypothetical protein